MILISGEVFVYSVNYSFFTHFVATPVLQSVIYLCLGLLSDATAELRNLFRHSSEVANVYSYPYLVYYILHLNTTYSLFEATS